MKQAMLAVHEDTKKRVIRKQAEMMKHNGQHVSIDKVIGWLLDNSKT